MNKHYINSGVCANTKYLKNIINKFNILYCFVKYNKRLNAGYSMMLSNFAPHSFTRVYFIKASRLVRSAYQNKVQHLKIQCLNIFRSTFQVSSQYGYEYSNHTAEVNVSDQKRRSFHTTALLS